MRRPAATAPDGGRARRALAYLRAIPAGEPVMLIRAEGLPTPATPFTADRELRHAIVKPRPAGRR